MSARQILLKGTAGVGGKTLYCPAADTVSAALGNLVDCCNERAECQSPSDVYSYCVIMWSGVRISLLVLYHDLADFQLDTGQW
jgi:hypothetical protein